MQTRLPNPAVEHIVRDVATTAIKFGHVVHVFVADDAMDDEDGYITIRIVLEGVDEDRIEGDELLATRAGVRAAMLSHGDNRFPILGYETPEDAGVLDVAAE